MIPKHNIVLRTQTNLVMYMYILEKSYIQKYIHKYVLNIDRNFPINILSINSIHK